MDILNVILIIIISLSGMFAFHSIELSNRKLLLRAFKYGMYAYILIVLAFVIHACFI